jgi:hypothetical protein
MIVFQAVEFEGFVALHVSRLRDQICTTEGPTVNCVMHVDFCVKGSIPIEWYTPRTKVLKRRENGQIYEGTPYNLRELKYTS